MFTIVLTTREVVFSTLSFSDTFTQVWRKKNWYRFIRSWLDKEIGFFQTCTHRSASNKSQRQINFYCNLPHFWILLKRRKKKQLWKSKRIVAVRAHVKQRCVEPNKRILKSNISSRPQFDRLNANGESI